MDVCIKLLQQGPHTDQVLATVDGNHDFGLEYLSGTFCNIERWKKKAFSQPSTMELCTQHSVNCVVDVSVGVTYPCDQGFAQQLPNFQQKNNNTTIQEV